jgi:Ethanolamine utilization protein EutJ (predicted chaperonin)
MTANDVVERMRKEVVVDYFEIMEIMERHNETAAGLEDKIITQDVAKTK